MSGTDGQSSLDLVKRVAWQTAILTLMAAAVFMLLGRSAVAIGLCLGAAVSVLNFFLIERMLPLRLGRTRAKSTAISFLGLMGRYPILAVPLIVGILSPAVSFPAAAVGLFGVQLTILLDRLVWPRIGGKM